MKYKSLLTVWLPLVIWAAFIWHLSSIPNLKFIASWWDYPVRKLGHMGVFGILGRLFARALTEDTFWSWKKIFICSLAFVVFYASLDEYHQTFTPGRHGSPIDVFIDTLGAWLALGLKP